MTKIQHDLTVAAKRRKLLALTIATTLPASLALPARAQAAWPTRPVRILAGFPPGGGTDITARILAVKLSEYWGQQVLVENRAGASGTIAADLVAKAPPDGHTLLMGLPNSNVVAQFAFPKLSYDQGRDFIPVVLVSQVSLVLTLFPGVPANDVKSFVALSRTRQLRYASSGNGSVQHLSTEAFKHATGADLLHIPYKGSGQAVVDLIAGQVDLNLDTMPTVLQHIKAGKLKAIAVGAKKRTVQLPELPPIADTVPGFEATNWYGLFAPAGTPREVVAKINADTNRALVSPDIRTRIIDSGGEPQGGTVEEFAAFIRSEIVRNGKLIKDANIRFE
ncbi:MAG: tripartite tricarboxylate transporter substrate binding protein [Burkholderiales bacterium]|nr:tripartite tricarboxylate transporter substrate binding protein [Burkholderiales bacterium]